MLLCTNAYTDDLWPGLRATIVPVRAWQFASKPLSASTCGAWPSCPAASR